MSLSTQIKVLGGLPTAGSPPAASSLSADEIVDLFTGTPDGTLFLRDDGTLAAPSGGFMPKYARISRGTSDQTGISGSFAEDYLQYNAEDTDPDGLVTISGDDVTFAAAGTYILLQHVYGMSGGFFSLHVNGSLVDRMQTNGATYEALPRILVTTGANQVVKFTAISSAALTMAYTDSVRTVNFVEILRIA